MRKKWGFAALCALFFFLSGAAWSAESGDVSTETSANEGKTSYGGDAPLKSEGTGAVWIGDESGRRLVDYQVKMDSCVILDEDADDELARIYYTSYSMRDGSRERPVTFFFNGGPGAASIYLHMGMFGPRGVTFEKEGLEIPKAPYKVQDNPDSLLDVTDMVFVDPVGTGFSKATLEKGAKGEKGTRDSKPFWGVREDLKSLGQFIRVWLSQNERWGAPVWLCGESYGGLRVAGLASSLLDGENIAVDGIVLVSPVISYAEVMSDTVNRAPFLYQMPLVASTAFYHKKLGVEFDVLTPAEYREHVGHWASDVYAPALSKGQLLDPKAEEEIALQLARFTGIPKEDFVKGALLLDVDLLVERVLAYEKLCVSYYDTRLTAPYSLFRRGDQSNVLTGPAFVGAWRRYLDEELGIRTDREYVLISGEANSAWNFTSGAERGRIGYPSTAAMLSEAMRKLPDLKIFAASGLYDAVTPAEGVAATLARLDVPRERWLRNVETRSYEGGHMFYTNSAERKRFADDMRIFMRGRTKAE